MASYTGHVDPGGEAARRIVGGLQIYKLSVGPMDNNAYLVVDSSGDAVLIDAANDPDRILSMVSAADARLAGIVTTHAHPDHWQALSDIKKQTQAPSLSHRIDAPAIGVPMDEVVEGGDTIEFGTTKLNIIHLRGHTDGSIALHLQHAHGDHLFSGDSLFPGGVGKTWSKDSFHQLLGDVQRRIFAELSDSTWVYPGHGDDTTLARERPQLADWRARGW